MLGCCTDGRDFESDSAECLDLQHLVVCNDLSDIDLRDTIVLECRLIDSITSSVSALHSVICISLRASTELFRMTRRWIKALSTHVQFAIVQGLTATKFVFLV